MTKKNYTRRYVITTYLVFWGAVMLVGLGFILSGQNKTVMNYLSAIASWVPTIILMLYFNKLFPGEKRKEWIKDAFKQKLKFGMLLCVTLCFFVAYVAIYYFTVRCNPVLSFSDLKGMTVQSILPIIFFAIIQGATGEEAGWRGFLQRHFEEKTNGKVIKSALMVGVIWSFWHTPLWLTTGLPPVKMLLYIVTFIIGNLCLAVTIACCYEYCRNLFVPMWIHFISNLFGTIIEPYIGDDDSMLRTRLILAIAYITVALIFALWYSIRKSRKGKQDELQSV